MIATKFEYGAPRGYLMYILCSNSCFTVCTFGLVKSRNWFPSNKGLYSIEYDIGMCPTRLKPGQRGYALVIFMQCALLELSAFLLALMNVFYIRTNRDSSLS